MTTPIPQFPPQEAVRPRLGRHDPILQELWAVKAALNAEAGYSIDKLIERANSFDLEATIARLKREVSKT
ncbi:MAG: hypothetical protein IPH35_03805 [Rhodoferax sp.]|nr:hypothetical protein [Rhodoferax sp.]